MVNKFHLLVGFILFLQINQLVCFGQRRNEKLILDAQLFEDTCTYKNDAFTISASLSNGGLFPIKVYTNSCISENVCNEGVRDGELFIIVTHDGVEYRYYESVIMKKHELPKKRWLWFRPIYCNAVFYMSHFLKEQQDIINKDFGIYSIKVAFINQPNDTVYSKPLIMHYFD